MQDKNDILKNDILKIFVLAVFVGFSIGSTHAQIIPSNLPPPQDISALIDTGTPGIPLQKKDGDLGIAGDMGADNASFLQDFSSNTASDFQNTVTVDKNVDFYGGLKVYNVDVGGDFVTTGIYDVKTIIIKKDAIVPSLIHTPDSQNTRWPDRLCFKQKVDKNVGADLKTQLVLCPDGM